MNKRVLLPAIVASVALLLPLAASAQTFSSYGQSTGVIVSVNGDRIALSNGTTVELRPGVAIEPGINLRPGMRVWVRGGFDNDGVLNADSVSANGPSFNRTNDPNARYYPNGWYDGNGFFHHYQ